MPGDEVIDDRVLERFTAYFADPTPASEAVDGWLAALPARLDEVRAAVRAGTDVAAPARRLQSPSAALGLRGVAQACAALADPGRGDSAPAALARLDEALLATWTALAARRAGAP